MCTQFFLKNNYLESNRNYLDDYANIDSRKYDMTLSGIYLYKYPKFKLNLDSICLYPSKYDANDLIDVIKKKYDISKSVIIGPGSNGILQNIIKLLLKKGDNIVTPFYTFNQAEYAATSLGCITRRVKCIDYSISLDNISKSIDSKTKIVYLCNPNNPTGIYLSSKKIIEFAKSVKSLVIVDESGIDFSDKESILFYKNIPDNLVVLRSFSKAFGLANMRIGYLICSEEFENEYIKNTTINEYSGLSVSFAKTMLENYNYVLNNINMIKKEREKMITELNKLGIEVIPSSSNTIMSKTPIDEIIIDKLFDNDVSVIKVYDEAGLIHFRIAIQDIKTNKVFIKKLRDIINNLN